LYSAYIYIVRNFGQYCLNEKIIGGVMRRIFLLLLIPSLVCALDAPNVDISLEQTGDDFEVTLLWDPVPGAEGYCIYSLEGDPFGTGLLLECVAEPPYTLITGGQDFYYVLAEQYTEQVFYYEPSSYLNFDDSLPGTDGRISPFAELDFNYFYLETFEDGALNTPGASANDGVPVVPSNYTDTVDGDDGVIDGTGWGRSYSAFPVTDIIFSFDADLLGNLPTHAGIVWTDVGASAGYYCDTYFEAFDAEGVSLGEIGVSFKSCV
jgi:hypothetical protein